MYMIDKYIINVLKFNLKVVCFGTVSSIVILKGIINFERLTANCHGYGYDHDKFYALDHHHHEIYDHRLHVYTA